MADEKIDAATAQAIEIAKAMREQEKAEEAKEKKDKTRKALNITIIVLLVIALALVVSRFFIGGWWLDW